MDNTMSEQPEQDKQAEYEYDWTAVKKLFKRKVSRTEFHVIGFTATTVADKAQLPVPKHKQGTEFLYTAAFFCKNVANEWFIYRVIFVLKRRPTKQDKVKICDKLTSGAYMQTVLHKRTKNPLAFIKDIVLLP